MVYLCYIEPLERCQGSWFFQIECSFCCGYTLLSVHFQKSHHPMTGHSLKLWYVAEWCMWLKFLHMYFMSRQGPSWIRGYCVLCTRLYLCNVVYFQKSNGIIPVVLTREQQANVCCLTLAWAQLFHVHVRAHSFISFNAFGTKTVGCWGMPTEPYWNACKSHYY